MNLYLVKNFVSPHSFGLQFSEGGREEEQSLREQKKDEG